MTRKVSGRLQTFSFSALPSVCLNPRPVRRTRTFDFQEQQPAILPPCLSEQSSPRPSRDPPKMCHVSSKSPTFAPCLSSKELQSTFLSLPKSQVSRSTGWFSLEMEKGSKNPVSHCILPNCASFSSFSLPLTPIAWHCHTPLTYAPPCPSGYMLLTFLSAVLLFCHLLVFIY